MFAAEHRGMVIRKELLSRRGEAIAIGENVSGRMKEQIVPTLPMKSGCSPS